MAGNANFDGIIAFTSEKMMSQKMTSIWTTAWPLLQMIKTKGLNFNTATEDPQGNSLLLPTIYLGPATSARIGTNANAFTPITPNGTQGITQAQYFYSRFENAMYLNATEKQLIGKSAGGTTRMPILPAKTQQLMDDFKNVISTSLLGTQNGTGQAGNGDITGEQYMLSTSNSPGGISQTTYPTWAANVVTNAGAFYEGLIDKEIGRINALGRGRADFIQLSWSSTNDVYNKLYGLIGPAQIIVDQGASVNYGFETFKYRGLDCFQDNKLGDTLAGSMVIGNSDVLHVSMKSDMPVLTTRDGTMRLPGTSSDEWFYEWWMTWGTSDPASLSLVSGIN